MIALKLSAKRFGRSPFEEAPSLKALNANRRDFLRQAGLTVAGAFGVPDWMGNSRADRAGLGRQHPSPALGASPIRGLMVDAGRLPEKLDYYRRVIDFCAEWGCNTLQFRLADDQGSALRFASAPGLITHRNAFTPEQLRDLAGYGERRGVNLLPEIESFGHTGYITRSPAYAHLLDGRPDGSSDFTGLCPVNPGTLELMTRLYGEVASIFPSIYLHAGCDEVNWGASDLSRQALRSRSRAQIWADYLNALNRIAADRQKELIVWGDYVLHKLPQVLALLDRQIVIMDWDYATNDAVPLRRSLDRVREHGARAIGAPAISCYRWGPRVGSEQLRNIDAYVNAYSDANDSASLGVIVTNWVPSRYVQNSIWDSFAYAAIALKEGTATAQTSGFRRFVEKHYQTDWNELWREVFESLYNAAPYWPGASTASWEGVPLAVPWSNDAELLALLASGAPSQNPFTRLASLLVRIEPAVLANLSDFRAFALSIQYLERLYWRQTVLLKQAGRPALNRERAALLIQAIAARDRSLAQALADAWRVGRFMDSTAALEPLFGLRPKDQMLFQWNQATHYSASLAHSPDRFYALLKG